MAFPTTKQFAALEERVEALEAKLGVGVVVPEIEDVLTLQQVYGDELAELLLDGGFTTPEQVKYASDADLQAVKGIGAATAKKIKEMG